MGCFQFDFPPGFLMLVGDRGDRGVMVFYFGIFGFDLEGRILFLPV